MRRRKTRQVKIGNVKIGAGAPVSVQSMAKTDTKDIKATVEGIKRLERKGCEIIRVAVKDSASSCAIKRIKSKIKIPLVADIHFNYKLALEAVSSGCDAIRLNPGNIKKKEHNLQVIEACKRKRLPIRIGLNSGSAGTSTSQGLVNLAIKYVKIFERERFYDIIISLKASDVYTTIEAYRKMARECEYPFHLGVTAAGVGYSGVIKSAIGIGALLAEGIGDTIRVSLTDNPEKEVETAKYILQSLGLRRFYLDIISCPTCGRCQVDLRKIVSNFSKQLRTTNYPSRYSGPLAEESRANARGKLRTRPLKVALMGCEVNGPGEAKDADIGIAFGKNSGALFKRGKIVKKLRAKDTVKELIKIL